MLVINGADDVHVPQHDTLVFEGRRDTVVELIPGRTALRDNQTPRNVFDDCRLAQQHSQPDLRLSRARHRWKFVGEQSQHR